MRPLPPEDLPRATRPVASGATDDAAALLRVILLGTIPAVLAIALTNAFTGGPVVPAILTGASLAFAGALVLVRRGAVRLAGGLVVATMVACVVSISALGGGVRDTVTLFYPLIMIVAAVVLDWHVLLGAGALCILAAAGVVGAEMAGWIVPWRHQASLQDLLDVSMVVVVTGLTMRVLIRGLRRRTAEARLESEARAASESRWRSLIETAPDRIISVARDGTIRFVSDAPSGGADPLVGGPVGSLTLPESRAELEGAIARVLETGTSNRVEAPGWRGDGHPAWYAFHIGPVWHEGRVESVTLIATDVWERKQIEAEREALIEELRLRNQELERFTYSVSHDLKAPLVTIRGFVGYVRQKAGSGELASADSDLERIEVAAGRMQTLLDELLELSRIGRVVQPDEKVSFGAVVQEAAELVRGRLQQTGATLDVAPDLPEVVGDRHRLVQVMQNLIDNAAKFGGGAGAPVIRVGSRDGPGAPTVLFVEDEGAGIDPEHRETVFGLFAKLDAKSEGTGLGLALVKRIVQLHGGRIWVEPGELERGARFCFTLPRGEPG